jgi:hypothetical protein
MQDLTTDFTAWADREFGPSPDPVRLPQTERFASYLACWKAASADDCRKRPKCDLAERCTWSRNREALQQTPAEWVMVPVEPTEEMVRASLAVEWPALYRDGITNPADGPGFRALTQQRAALARARHAAVIAAAPSAPNDGPSLAELVERFKPWSGPEVSGSVQRPAGPALSGGMGDKHEGTT